MIHYHSILLNIPPTLNYVALFIIFTY